MPKPHHALRVQGEFCGVVRVARLLSKVAVALLSLMIPDVTYILADFFSWHDSFISGVVGARSLRGSVVVEV